MSQNTVKRIEIKEVFRPKDLLLLNRALKLSRFSFRSKYPPRKVNSVYFDTLNYNALLDSIEGNSFRTKHRLRWYGYTEKKTNAIFEIKRKQGHLSWKISFKNTFTVNPSAKSWERFIHTKSSSEEIDIILSRMEPTSIVSYDRSYYSSHDEKVRVTLDQNLTSCLQLNRFKPNTIYKRPHFGFIILEIKVLQKNEHLIHDVLKDFPFSPKRFSKYCESLVPQKYF